MKSLNPVVHFEMPYVNGKRVSNFYAKAFGWGMSDAGLDMGHYLVAITTETDKKRMVKTPGTINGGFYKKSKSTNPFPSFVISVKDVAKTVVAIKKAGGKVVGKPQQIPGIGLWAVFKDSEGNRVSILQSQK